MFCVFGFGCVRNSSHVGTVATNSGEVVQKTIGVYVGGAVNKQGRYDLKPPFTVERAIKQAGGIDRFEEGQNRSVSVIRLDRSKSKIQRKDYDTVVLRDGDTLIIPRH